MFQFTEDCLTGIESIDEEHRGLFEMINQAAEQLKEKKTDSVDPVAATKVLVESLKKYAATHFAHEEAYMEQTGDPELPRQRKEHAAFIEKVNDVNLEFEEEQAGRKALGELLEYLSRWLYHHILGSDIMIGKMGKAGEAEDPFAFTDKFWTGVEFIDAEHQRLFEIIRETDEVIRAELLHDKYDEIVRLLTELKDYTVVHFSDEEAYMESINYPGLGAQKAAHEAFVNKVNSIDLEDVDNHQEKYLNELIRFLLDWLTNHILLMDKKIPVSK